MAEKTSRNYYTDYVSHMIRFYISRPDGIQVREYSCAEVNNWHAVHAVFSDLDKEEAQLLTDVYRVIAMPFSGAVSMCAYIHDMTENEVWKLIAHTNKRIAERRGLI